MQYDLLLCHAPSVYDFRTRDDVHFAYLSNSATVHVSSIFEMPTVGMFAIKQHVQKAGFHTEFFNVASQMLRDPDFDVPAFFQKAKAKYFGVDLHWLVHCHGALELMKLYKEIHPDAKTLVGGIASTYYHKELIDYPQVDYVVRGYDTLAPIEQLMKAEHDPALLREVPNLSWKERGQAVHNEMTHIPKNYTATVDWSEVFSPDRKAMTPYNVLIPQAGCEYNCTWCGGSRYFFKKYMGLNKRVQKTPEALAQELGSLLQPNIKNHTVTMIDFWHETEELFKVAEDVFVDTRIDSVHFMLHRLPTVAKGKRLATNVNAIVELSPDSHDLEVSKAAGRGYYTMEEMEAFIDATIDDIYSYEVYFMIGLPKQTVQSVWDTVDYCEHLLKKYQGKNIVPYVAPMLPFLDPGSMIYDNAEEWGYKISCHSLEDHRQALLAMNWKNRLNYETKWMSRDELVDVSYKSVAKLSQLKNKYGQMPTGMTNGIVTLLEQTYAMMREIDVYQAMPESAEKSAVGVDLRKRIFEYNQKQFKMVRSQQRPVDFGFAKQQWFDTEEAFEQIAKHGVPPRPPRRGAVALPVVGADPSP